MTPTVELLWECRFLPLQQNRCIARGRRRTGFWIDMWRFPLGTFAINVTGAFLIGLLMAPFTGRWQGHTNWRLFLVAGVLGGYTTFSSFEYETL